MGSYTQEGLADNVLPGRIPHVAAIHGQGGKTMQPELSWRSFLSQQFDDGPQPLMANGHNHSGRKPVISRQPPKYHEIPVLQRWNHAEAGHANDPQAQQGANPLNQADQSTG